MNSILQTILTGIVCTLITYFIMSKRTVTRAEFEAHIKAADPHRDCPVHTSELTAIKITLQRLELKIDRLIERHAQ